MRGRRRGRGRGGERGEGDASIASKAALQRAPSLCLYSSKRRCSTASRNSLTLPSASSCCAVASASSSGARPPPSTCSASESFLAPRRMMCSCRGCEHAASVVVHWLTHVDRPPRHQTRHRHGPLLPNAVAAVLGLLVVLRVELRARGSALISTSHEAAHSRPSHR